LFIVGYGIIILLKNAFPDALIFRTIKRSVVGCQPTGVSGKAGKKRGGEKTGRSPVKRKKREDNYIIARSNYRKSVNLVFDQNDPIVSKIVSELETLEKKIKKTLRILTGPAMF
jgi:hypothetical protein